MATANFLLVLQTQDHQHHQSRVTYIILFHYMLLHLHFCSSIVMSIIFVTSGGTIFENIYAEPAPNTPEGSSRYAPTIA